MSHVCKKIERFTLFNKSAGEGFTDDAVCCCYKHSIIKGCAINLLTNANYGQIHLS